MTDPLRKLAPDAIESAADAQAPLNSAMLDEIAEIWRLVHDQNVSAEAIGIRIRNTWPALEASSLPSADRAPPSPATTTTENLDKLQFGRVLHERPMTIKARAAEPIPSGIFYSIETNTFHAFQSKRSCGRVFHGLWMDRWREFPRSAEEAASIVPNLANRCLSFVLANAIVRNSGIAAGPLADFVMQEIALTNVAEERNPIKRISVKLDPVQSVTVGDHTSGFRQPAEQVFRVIVGKHHADFSTYGAARDFRGAILAMCAMTGSTIARSDNGSDELERVEGGLDDRERG